MLFSTTSTSPLSNFLTLEEKVVIANSLAQVRHSGNLNDIKLIARVIGTERDYLIARGCGADPLLSPRLLYSINGQDWVPLPTQQLKPAARQRVEQATSFFAGNVAFEFEQTNYKSPPNKRNVPQTTPAAPDNNNNNKQEPQEQQRFRVSELDRLTNLCMCLDDECHVVPRGAYLCRADGSIRQNPRFCGLSWTQATKLDQYHLLRLPLYLPSRTQLELGADPLRNFLKPLSQEVSPLLLEQTHRTKWNIKQQPIEGIVTIESVEWPGFLFYHRPGTPEFGHFYCGTGLRNRDFPFLIPPPAHNFQQVITIPPALILRERFSEVQPTAEQQAESERLKKVAAESAAAAAAVAT